MNEAREYHVLTKLGDAHAEVDRAVAEFGSPYDAGMHRYFFVSRANQTVVMASSPDSPIARRLRSLSGWMEPGEYS